MPDVEKFSLESYAMIGMALKRWLSCDPFDRPLDEIRTELEQIAGKTHTFVESTKPGVCYLCGRDNGPDFFGQNVHI